MKVKATQWIVWALSACIAGFFVFDHNASESLVRQQFQRTAESALDRKATDLLQTFRFLQVGLRNIALLPGIRDARTGNTPANSPDAIAAGRISAETRDTVQQFYNNLASLISISEVYMVAKGFQPAQGETPVFMFDQLIVDATTAATETSSGKAKNPDEPEEAEEEEYVYYENTLKSLEKNHTQFTFKTMSDIPFWISHALRTCDNSQYTSKSKGDAKNAVGIAAVVPIYERTGDFKGLITAVVRMNVFEAVLMGVPFLPVTEEDNQKFKAEAITLPPPSRFRLSSKELNISLMDRRSEHLHSEIANYRADKDFSNLFSRELPLSNNATWKLEYLADTATYLQERGTLRIALFFKIALTLVFAGLVSFGLFQSAKKKDQIEEITRHMDELARGELNEQAVFSGTGEVKKLAHAYAEVVRDLRNKTKLARTIAEGDLRIAVLNPDDTHNLTISDSHSVVYKIPSASDKLGHSMKDMVESLTRMVSHLATLSHQLEQSSQEIASGSAALSHDSTGTSQSVEKMSHILTSFSQSVQENTNQECQALTHSQAASQKAQQGVPELHSITSSLREAQQAGERIGSVVKLIEDIAFQTNLLALNASVEAARAGKAGKGFSVVAGEVRNLANRSSQAVHEVESHVGTIAKIIAQGAAKTDSVEQIFGEVVKSALDVTTALQHVAHNTTQQNAEVRAVMEQVDSLTESSHRNSALSEQLSAASMELRKQAQEIHAFIAKFQINK
jgi:methyl-accepting chemotaxis protein